MLVFQSEKWKYIYFAELLNDGAIKKLLLIVVYSFFNEHAIALLDTEFRASKENGFSHGAYRSWKNSFWEVNTILAFTFNTLDSVLVLFCQQLRLSLCSDTECFSHYVDQIMIWRRKNSDYWWMDKRYDLAFYPSSYLNE